MSPSTTALDYVKLVRVREIMDQLPFFQQLPHAFNKLLSRAMVLRTLLIDECVYEQNDDGDCMYIVLQGTVAVLDPSLPQPHNYIGTVTAGDCFGTSGLSTPPQPRRATMMAIEDTTVLAVLTLTNFQECIQRYHPETLIGGADHQLAELHEVMRARVDERRRYIQRELALIESYWIHHREFDCFTFDAELRQMLSTAATYEVLQPGDLVYVQGDQMLADRCCVYVVLCGSMSEHLDTKQVSSLSSSSSHKHHRPPSAESCMYQRRPSILSTAFHQRRPTASGAEKFTITDTFGECRRLLLPGDLIGHAEMNIEQRFQHVSQQKTVSALNNNHSGDGDNKQTITTAAAVTTTTTTTTSSYASSVRMTSVIAREVTHVLRIQYSAVDEVMKRAAQVRMQMHYNMVRDVLMLPPEERKENQVDACVDILSPMKFFAKLDDRALAVQLCRVLQYQVYEAGDVLFRQNDIGRCFYIILHGSITIHVNDTPASIVAAADGGDDTCVRSVRDWDHSELQKHFGRCVVVLSVGDGFGERSVIDSRPRSSSAICEHRTELLVLNQRDYLHLFGRRQHERVNDINHISNILSAKPSERTDDQVDFVTRRLKSLEFFNDMPLSVRKYVVAHASYMEAMAGTTLYAQGDPAESLYILLEGMVEVSSSGGNASSIEGTDNNNNSTMTRVTNRRRASVKMPLKIISSGGGGGGGGRHQRGHAFTFNNTKPSTTSAGNGTPTGNTTNTNSTSKHIIKVLAGGHFGETALSQNICRQTTAVVKEDARIVLLPKMSYLRTMRKVRQHGEGHQEEWVADLRRTEPFKDWTNIQLLRLAFYLQERTYRPNDVIVRQGDPVDAMYLVLSGECVRQRRVHVIKGDGGGGGGGGGDNVDVEDALEAMHASYAHYIHAQRPYCAHVQVSSPHITSPARFDLRLSLIGSHQYFGLEALSRVNHHHHHQCTVRAVTEGTKVLVFKRRLCFNGQLSAVTLSRLRAIYDQRLYHQHVALDNALKVHTHPHLTMAHNTRGGGGGSSSSNNNDADDAADGDEEEEEEKDESSRLRVGSLSRVGRWLDSSSTKSLPPATSTQKRAFASRHRRHLHTQSSKTLLPTTTTTSHRRPPPAGVNRTLTRDMCLNDRDRRSYAREMNYTASFIRECNMKIQQRQQGLS